MARIGLALGSGAARGWAHIGVIRGLEQAGLAPSIVTGTSIGAVVGAAYAAGELNALERRVRQLDWRTILSYFDLTVGGGLLKARRIFEFLAAGLPNQPIESLPMPFAAVATDLSTGEEVWLREGPLHDSLRASVALPGLVTPVRLSDRWLVDGGLVNPVPVSLCRALGAEVVFAVDLNTTLLGRRLRQKRKPDEATGTFDKALQDLVAEVRRRLGADRDAEDGTPSIYDVITNSINIMQVRITRSRMAGDPPELLVTPQLGDFGLLDFDRAADAIDEGIRAVEQALTVRPPAAFRQPG